MTSVTLSGSPALTISDNPHGAAYWLDEDGLIEPEVEYRTTFADDSPHVAGALATQAVRALASLGLTVYTKAADAATLKAQKRALEAIVGQFSYTATVTLVGDPDVYACLPARLSWGTADSGMVRGLIARAVITIPVQPLEA
jgi:hypothetical protein